MRTLVTGASGFIGYKLVNRLLEEGNLVYALTRTSLDLKHDNLIIIKGDLLNINILIDKPKIDVIFHTSAAICYEETDVCKSQLTNDNILATISVIQFADKNQIKKIIFSSSCSVYDRNYNINNIISESFSLCPYNMYGLTKLAAELIVENYAQKENVQIVVLRYSSIFGIGQKNNSILPIFINNAIKGNDLMIFGSGNRVQNYVWSEDVVVANMLCIDKILPKSSIFNIGSSQNITDYDLALQIKTVWKSESEIKILKKHSYSETFLNYDISAAKTLLNYQPKSLKQGLELINQAQ
jgi:nucleoside-diphosphate-sugar epimerase